MILEILIAILIGVLVGTFTGITPRIHVNLVATTLLAMSPVLLKYTSPLALAVFIMSLAVTHSLLDTIPSTFLGAPDDENALSVLPAQKMLLKGEGHMAVKITITGTFFGLLAAITLIPLFVVIAKIIYPVIKPYLFYLLIGIILFMFYREKERFWSVFLFFLSGVLGLIVLSIPTLKEPLFPLLSGLFGVAGLLLSYVENTKIPLQRFTEEIGVSFKDLFKVLSASSFAVFLIQFFPGLGPSQGAVLSSQFFKDIKDRAYLALVGAMGTMSVVFSLVTFFVLGKAKDGSIVVMSKIFEIGVHSFIILLLSFLIAGSISVFLVFLLSKKFSAWIVKVNYKVLVISIVCFIVLMAFMMDSWIGILVLITSSAVGLVAPLKNIPRSNAMGCLLLPVIMFLALNN